MIAAVRTLQRSPRFMLTVASLFALGIGANVATFSALDQLILEPPPGVSLPGQVRRLYDRHSANSLESADRANIIETRRNFYFDEYQALASFHFRNSIAAYFTATTDVMAGARHESLVVTFAAGPYFAVLGVPAVAGRLFDASEISPHSPTTPAIVSSTFSATHFGNNRAAIGSSITIDGVAYTIVGVLGSTFRGLDGGATDVWLPIGAVGNFLGDADWATGTRANILRIIARVRARTDEAAIVRAATVVFRNTEGTHDPSAVAQLGHLQGRMEVDLDNDSQGLSILERLLGVSLAILLITCISVANLATVRGLQRQRDVAIRFALGATTANLVTLLASEGILACLIGGAAGTAVAVGAGNVLRRFVVTGALYGRALDWRVLVFAMTLVGFGGIVMSLIPMRLVRRSNIVGAITGTSLGPVRMRARVREILVVIQVALTMLLLVGAGLFGRSLFLVSGADIGYDTPRTIVATVHPPAAASDTANPIGLRVSRAARRLEALPAVESAGLTSVQPMSGQSYVTNVVAYADGIRPIQGRGYDLFRSYVSDDYFRASGSPMVAGRPFSESDGASSTPVIIVNQQLAHVIWGSQSPLGRCITFNVAGGECLTVVGVVPNLHVSRVIEFPVLQLYLPLSQAPSMWRNERATTIVVRARARRLTEATAEARDSLEAWLSQAGTVDVKSMSAMVAPELWPWRVGALLFGATGILAALVSILAVYSTMSYSWAQRRREVAIRIAIGATTTQIGRQVLFSVLTIAVIGVGIGAVAAALLGKVVEALLYHVSATDLATFCASAIALLTASVIAGIHPMLAARRTDVVTALKSE